MAAIKGTEGPDNLTGTAGDDFIEGLGGPDRLDGGAGSDSLKGGAGNDTIHGDADGDYIDGGAGINAVNGGLGRDIFFIDTAGATTMMYGHKFEDFLYVSESLLVNGDTAPVRYSRMDYVYPPDGKKYFSFLFQKNTRVVFMDRGFVGTEQPDYTFMSTVPRIWMVAGR